jgi:hypothetical protein
MKVADGGMAGVCVLTDGGFFYNCGCLTTHKDLTVMGHAVAQLIEVLSYEPEDRELLTELILTAAQLP